MPNPWWRFFRVPVKNIYSSEWTKGAVSSWLVQRHENGQSRNAANISPATARNVTQGRNSKRKKPNSAGCSLYCRKQVFRLTEALTLTLVYIQMLCGRWSMASYQVEFAYAGVEDDEITLEIGDIITDCVQKEDGQFFHKILAQCPWKSSTGSGLRVHICLLSQTKIYLT